MGDLPAPLVAADVDLAGFSSFMLNVDRLLTSELVAIGTPEQCWAAVLLWCRAWKQSPPASLPDDDRVLAAFSGTGKRWPKVRDVALRGFIKCSDGRLYHKTLADEANEAWTRRLDHREAVDNKTERQSRWRQRIKDASQKLRSLGITPPRGASLETLERLIVDREKTTDVVVKASTVDVSADGDEIGKTGQDRTGQDKEEESAALRDAAAKRLEPHDDGPARFREVSDACKAALGSHAPSDAMIGPIVLMVEQGVPLRTITTILRSERERPRRRPIHHWSVWADIVAEKLDAAPKIPARPPEDPADPLIDLKTGFKRRESQLREEIARWRENPHRWRDGELGPPPGKPGCRIPPHLLPQGEAA